MIKILRPVNLCILALTQLVVYYLFIAPYHYTAEIELTLGDTNLFLLILVGLLLTSAGYLINDYYDFDIDRRKKGKKQFSNRSSYLIYYSIFHLVGFTLAVYLAYAYEAFQLSLLYIIAAFILHIYSSRLKSSILWGNILVSLFTAFSFGILWLAEWDSFRLLCSKSPELCNELTSGIIAFMIFCFLINLSREIMKDVEDMQEDSEFGIITFPIKYGIERSKVLCTGILILLILTIIQWSLITWNLNKLLLSSAFLILPTVVLLVKTLKSSTVYDFGFLSRLSKLNMLFALIYLILA